MRMGDTEYSGKAVDRIAAYEETGLEPEEIYAMRQLIEMQPVADVAPVRHGKWKEWDDETIVGINKFGKDIYRHFRYYTCSLCCKGSAIKSNYCPNCGARMDGKEKG